MLGAGSAAVESWYVPGERPAGGEKSEAGFVFLAVGIDGITDEQHLWHEHIAGWFPWWW